VIRRPINADAQHRDVVEFGTRRLLVVVAVMAATLMQTLDSTITNVALPTIQGNIGASQEEATWVITAYTIAAIVVIPRTPWLQDRFGRRNYYVASIAGFTMASVACGASASLGALAFWRVIQGLFGGGLLATGQLVLRDTFPPEGLSASQGIFTVGAIMGPALGPPLGGILVDNWSWNWCFDVNVLPGTFAAIVLFLLLRDPQRPRKVPFDLAGVVLLACALGSLQHLLTEGEPHYWLQDPVNALMAAVCLLCSVGFVVYELTFSRAPIVDLHVLANRGVWSGSLLALALGGALLGSTYVLPQFVQGLLGFTPTLSGMLFLLRAIPVALFTPVIVWLVAKVDARVLLFIGFVANGIAMFALAFDTTLQASFWTLAMPLAISGASSALLFTPLTVAVLGGIPSRDGQAASAFINLAVQLGGSVAVALLGVVIDRRAEFHSITLGSQVNLKAPPVAAFLHSHSLAQLSALVQGQSLTLSYADASFVVGVASLVCIPLILFMHRRSAAPSLANVGTG
jgi:MFS transporter, DHA2 family, multidrug resistance protein